MCRHVVGACRRHRFFVFVDLAPGIATNRAIGRYERGETGIATNGAIERYERGETGIATNGAIGRYLRVGQEVTRH